MRWGRTVAAAAVGSLVAVAVPGPVIRAGPRTLLYGDRRAHPYRAGLFATNRAWAGLVDRRQEQRVLQADTRREPRPPGRAQHRPQHRPLAPSSPCSNSGQQS
ncbi:hypothetical protein SALBM311S_02039 [Streptomyces alboniger]